MENFGWTLYVDLTEMKLPPGVSAVISPDRSILLVKLTFIEGFYEKEDLRFCVRVDNYPQRPPTIQALTEVYHPCISSDRSLRMEILENDVWLQGRNTIVDVVRELHRYFTEAKFLTERFTV